MLREEFNKLVPDGDKVSDKELSMRYEDLVEEGLHND